MDFKIWFQEEPHVLERLLSLGSQQQNLESYTGPNFKSDKRDFKKFGRSSGSTLNAGSEQKDDASCPLDRGTHRLWSCEKFKKKSVADRYNFVQDKNLCSSCSNGSHAARNCQKRCECGFDGCEKTHNRLLHTPKKEKAITS